MHKIGLLFVGSIVLILLGCAASSNYYKYHDGKYGFSADFPKNWTVRKNSGGYQITLIAPRDSKNDLWAEHITFTIAYVDTTHRLFQNKSRQQYYAQFGDALLEHYRYESNGIERDFFVLKDKRKRLQTFSYNTLFKIDNRVFFIKGIAAVQKRIFRIYIEVLWIVLEKVTIP